MLPVEKGVWSSSAMMSTYICVVRAHQVLLAECWPIEPRTGSIVVLHVRFGVVSTVLQNAGGQLHIG